VVAVLAIAVWLLPLAVVLLTSLHTPEAAASGGWWSGGFGFGSYRDAFASGELLDALSNTAMRSVMAALLLVVIAVPAAYALARGGLSRRTGRILIAVTTVLAVVPPQTVIVELGRVFDDLHLLGAPTALTLVHTAFAVPLAVLLLRAAFVSARPDPARARLLDPGSVLFAVARESWPAVLTVAVLEFVLVWNDFVVGFLLGGPEAGQVTFVLYDQTREFTTSSGVLTAGAVVATVIPLALVLGTGKWLVLGFTRGVRR
jgi:alpha-glucoside transport system permease protein